MFFKLSVLLFFVSCFAFTSAGVSSLVGSLSFEDAKTIAKRFMPADIDDQITSFAAGPSCNGNPEVPLVPVVECIKCLDSTCSLVTITYGVRTCNPCTVTLPIGSGSNFFSPGPANLSQPTTFIPGPYNSGVFTITVRKNSAITWTLVTNGVSNSAVVSSAAPGGPYCPTPTAPYPPSSLFLCTNPCNANCSNLYTPIAPGQTQMTVFYAPNCTCGCVAPEGRIAVVVAGCRNTSQGGQTAKRLAQGGFAKVVVTSRRIPYCDPDIIALPNVYLYPKHVDVSRDSDVEALFGDLANGNPDYNIPKLPRLDVVVSVPGAPNDGMMFQSQPSKYLDVVNNNQMGHFRDLYWATRMFNLSQSNSTHLFAFGSVSGEIPSPGEGIYGSSKYGVKGMGVNLNVENALMAANGTTAPYPHVIIIEPTTINSSFSCESYFFSDCGAFDPIVAGQAAAACAGLAAIGVPIPYVTEGIYQLSLAPGDPACLDDRYLFGQPSSYFDQLFAIQPINLAYLGTQRQLRQYMVDVTTEFTPPASYFRRQCPY